MSWLDLPFAGDFTEEELPDGMQLDELGVEMPDLQDLPDEEFDVTPSDLFFESLSSNLRGVQAPRPRNFWEGLAVGGVQGLAGRGARTMSAREKFEKSKETRRKAIDESNKQATLRYKTERGGELRARRGEGRLAKREEEKLRREQAGKLTPEQELQKIEAEAAARARGTRSASEGMPETPAERRARETADRANAAAERANRLAEVGSISKLADDYRVDPDITAYRTATQNLSTIEKASKLRSGPGDLAMVIAYVRATEPGVLSVVREEEKRGVQASVGQFRKYANLPQEWFSGQRLTDSGRAELLRSAREVASAQRKSYDRATQQFKDRAAAFGVNPDLVIRDYGSTTEEIVPSNGRTPIVDFDQ